MKNLAKSIFIFLLMAMSSSVWASSFNVADITIENPWSRATVKGIPNGVAYFALHNNGSEDDKLLSVSAQVSDRAELHTHEKDGDVMRMRQVEYIKVPAGEMVELKPSGLHVMLLELIEPLKEGDSFPLTLVFERSGEVKIDVVVHSMGKSRSDNDHKMHDHH